MKKRLKHSACALIGILGVIAALRVYAIAAPEEEKQDAAYTSMAVFARAMQLIRQDYVDEKKVSYEQLTHAALRGMLASLDPHSQFMEPSDFKGMQDDTNSRFGGLGVHFEMRDERLMIISLMEGSPGARAGLQPGDVIVKIEGKSTERMEFSDAVNLLRGEIGQKLTLTVARSSSAEVRDFTMVRENFSVSSVRDARILSAKLGGDFKVGYARITQFNVPTAEELGSALDELEKQGLQAMVLDLRNNPGGLLDSAVNVAGQFLPPRTPVVSTEGRVPSQSRVYRTPDKVKIRAKYPVAILINGSSASGSEIVAGALKDLNRAILVGETTFGKGSVQSVIRLQDESAVRLTTAKYYTPSKQVIHERGVSPNIFATMTAEEEGRLRARWHGEYSSEAERQQLADFRDTQLERAVDALKGLMIYGKKSARGETKKGPSK